MKEAVKTLQKWTDSWVIGKTEYMWNGGSDEDLDAIHASIRAVLTALESATARADRAEKWRLALESFTPGGSEYVNDLAKCIAHLHELITDRHNAKKELVRERNRADKAEAAEKALASSNSVKAFIQQMKVKAMNEYGCNCVDCWGKVYDEQEANQ